MHPANRTSWSATAAYAPTPAAARPLGRSGGASGVVCCCSPVSSRRPAPGGEGEGGDQCRDRNTDRPPERVLEGARGAMSEQRLEDDRDDRNAEGGANPLGDPGVHRGVGDGRRRDVLIGDRHGRNENGTVTAAASTKLATVTRRAPRRADLLALLTSMSRARATFTAVAAAAAFSGLLVDTGLTPRKRVTRSSATSRSGAIRPFTDAPTTAVSSTWSASHPACSRCLSTWCATTCS